MIASVAVFAAASIAGAGVGTALILALPAGIAAGAVAAELIEERDLNDQEIRLARRVFGDQIPYDRVRITNLGGVSGRKFAAPSVDDRIYLNLGTAYADPLGAHGRYDRPGQLLVHELTHAWQIAHAQFLPGLMCSWFVNQGSDMLGDHLYEYGPGGPGNEEAQASLVDEWYAASRMSADWRELDQGNPFYRFIWPDILERVPVRSAPANLRASASSAITVPSGRRERMDALWVDRDGGLTSDWWEERPGNGWNDHGRIDVVEPTAPPRAPLTCIARQPRHLDAFWSSADGTIRTTWWDIGEAGLAPRGSTLPLTEPGASVLGSAIVAISRTSEHLDIFWLGADGSVRSHWWDALAGHGWQDHPAFSIAGAGAADVSGGISVVARTRDHMDVFWIGADGSVATNWWDLAPGFGWHDHEAFSIAPPGSARPGSPIAAIARTPDDMEVFWISPDGAIAQRRWSATPVMDWSKDPDPRITGAGAAAPQSGLAALTRNPTQIDIFWVTPDGAIGTHWWNAAPDSGWDDHVPFTIAPAGTARPDSALTAAARTPEHLDVFWFAPNGDVVTHWADETAGLGWFDHDSFTIDRSAIPVPPVEFGPIDDNPLAPRRVDIAPPDRVGPMKAPRLGPR